MQDDRIPGVFTPAELVDRVKIMAGLGATVIRVNLQWDLVAATKRPANPTDPADPAYNWTGYDGVVDAAKANGVEVLFTVWGTPVWARDPSVKNHALPWGNARPDDPKDYGDFATAAATRYAPRGVHKWEAWNEPNIDLFLRPQFEKRGKDWVAVSPQTYAELLTAFSRAVKDVDPTALIGGGVMAPAGDDPTRPNRTPKRVRPDQFLRELDALPTPPPMDVVSHHPYPIRPPERKGGPNFIDLYNFERLVTTIDATYLKGKPIWLTEYGFGTAPVENYKLFFPPQRQAELIVDAFARTRRNKRVEMATYFHLQDNPSWKSGLIDEQGTPKPGRDAFALPLFNAGPGRDGGTRVLGQVRATPKKTTVTIEWRSGDDWTTAATAETTDDGTFSAIVGSGAAGQVRATWTGKARSGETVTWTSPPLALPARA